VKKIPLPCFVVAAISALWWLPHLFAKGMFMDGVYNALFAHNLASGVGSFWAPQTIYYLQPAYWDNPQLSSFFLSCFYRLLGDNFYVERVYSLVCAVIQLMLIGYSWQVFFAEDVDVKKYFWLPCLLWLISPLVGWCYSNNLMENTMAVFTTASVLSFFSFLRRKENLLMWSPISGFLIFLAFITKGPTGLFPLTVPLFFLWSVKNFTARNAMTYVFMQTAVFILIFLMVFNFPEPKNFLLHYVDAQLLPVLKHEVKNENSHFVVLGDLFFALLPLAVLSVTAVFLPKKFFNDKRFLKTTFSFMAVGLTASLPIMLSAKQHKYYLLPSLSMFVWSFSLLIMPLVKFVEEKLKGFSFIKYETASKIFLSSVVFLSLLLAVINKNSFARDKELLTDIEKIQPLIQSEKILRADWLLYDAWLMRAYLDRLYGEKLCMPDENAPAKFYLTKPGKWGDKLPANSPRIFQCKTFDLYKIESTF
jgi:hypothetical protein